MGAPIQADRESCVRRHARRFVRAVVERAGVPASWVGYRWVKEESVLDSLNRHGGPGAFGHYEQVFPETFQQNPLPQNVTSPDELPIVRDWWGFSFREVPTRRSSETVVVTLPNCSVIPAENPDGEFHPAVLDADGHALELRENWFRSFHGLFLRSSRGVRKATEVTWVMERVYTNHAHWLTGPLPKILLLKERGQLENVYLPEARTPTMEGSLRMLGLDPDDFPSFDFEHVLEAGKLTTINNDRLGRETVCSVRDAFQDPSTSPSRRVYISRDEASYRRLVNEDEVWALLREAGFERVYMETLSFEQQVQLMQETAVLVAPHGAGLANMLFLDPSACVVEIAVKDYPSPDFYAMAASLGLRYGVLFGDGVGDRLPPWRDLRAPAADVDRLLASLPPTTSSY
jgi:hypothetical protein